jgi:amidase
MVIGFYVDDQVIRACPTARKAVFKAVNVLHQQGHTVIRFQPPCPKKALLLLAKLYCSFKANPSCLQTKVDESKLDSLHVMVSLDILPHWFKKILLKVISFGINDPFMGQLMDHIGGTSSFSKTRNLQELMELQVEKEEYESLFSIAWQQPDMDALICPVHCTPPLPNASTPFNWMGMFYSALYNLLDYPVGIVPRVSQVGPADGVPNAVEYAHHERFTQHGKHHFNFLGVMAMEEMNACFLDGKLSDVSVGVQVVGKPFEEEKVLAVMKILSLNI